MVHDLSNQKGRNKYVEAISKPKNQIVRTVPKDYPNPYIHNDYKRPYATFICWLKTPTGRRSKWYQYITVYAVGKYKDMTVEELYKVAQKEISFDSFKSEFRKGYTTGELFLKSMFGVKES